MPVGEEGKFVDPVAFSRHLRKHPTLAKKILRERLANQSSGFRFISQHRIRDYYVDFCCRSHRVVVELDGDAHIGREEEDELRDANLSAEGYLVLRFQNDEVLNHLERVIAVITDACA